MNRVINKRKPTLILINVQWRKKCCKIHFTLRWNSNASNHTIGRGRCTVHNVRRVNLGFRDALKQKSTSVSRTKFLLVGCHGAASSGCLRSQRNQYRERWSVSCGNGQNRCRYISTQVHTQADIYASDNARMEITIEGHPRTRAISFLVF